MRLYLSPPRHDAPNLASRWCRQQITGWISSEVCKAGVERPWGRLRGMASGRLTRFCFQTLSVRSRSFALLSPVQRELVFDPDTCSLPDLGTLGGARQARCRLRFSQGVNLSRHFEKQTIVREACRNNLSTCLYRYSTIFHAKLAESLKQLSCCTWEPGGGLCTCRPHSCRVVQAETLDTSHAEQRSTDLHAFDPLAIHLQFLLLPSASP